LPVNVDQLFRYGYSIYLKTLGYGACFMVYLTIYPLAGRPLPMSLHRSEDSTPTEQIEGHLPEKAVNAVLDKPGKPCPESPTVQMA
jgi:hypothetical protein